MGLAPNLNSQALLCNSTLSKIPLPRHTSSKPAFMISKMDEWPRRSKIFWPLFEIRLRPPSYCYSVAKLSNGTLLRCHLLIQTQLSVFSRPRSYLTLYIQFHQRLLLSKFVPDKLASFSMSVPRKTRQDNVDGSERIKRGQ